MVQPKVIFLGNCQAQSFESLAGHLNLGIEIISAPPIWEVTEANVENLIEKISSADIVFSQRMSPRYPVTFVRNAVLKERFGAKVIVWPNIYFDGYFPGVRYLYNELGKVVGPLRDYHFQWIIDGWREGLSVDETALTVIRPSSWTGSADFLEVSLRELRLREKDADVKISDYIQNNFRRNKLFYSMNHPKTSVLGEMLRRMLSWADIPYHQNGIESYSYNLDEIIIPAFPIFRDRYRPTFKDDDKFKGVAISTETGNPENKVEYYGLSSLIECYYRFYDRVQPDT